jgi:hypothetical protein
VKEGRRSEGRKEGSLPAEFLDTEALGCRVSPIFGSTPGHLVTGSREGKKEGRKFKTQEGRTMDIPVAGG